MPQNGLGRMRLRSSWGTVAAYAVMLAATLAVFFGVRIRGDRLVATSAPTQAASSGSSSDWLLHLLIALIAIIVLGRLLGRLFAYLHQPPVIGEVVAGILLGPSLIGEQISGWIIPSMVIPYLNAIAQLGVVLYMFMIGLELDPSVLKNRARTIVVTAHASVVLPFILGVASALVLFPRLSASNVTFTSFSLFVGVAMSITAFPVLARILGDYELSRTKLGALSLSCAAVQDFTAWCLLAFVVGIVRAQAGSGVFVVIYAIVYIAFMFLVMRPLVARFVRRWEAGKHSGGVFAVIFVFLFVSAMATEAMGIHAIFGAFLAGAIIPHDSMVARDLTRQLRGVVTIVLLPAFFAFAGIRTRVDLLSDWSLWAVFALILAVAVVGKFGGSYVASRLTGLSNWGAAALGTLMNTRGLMELIVLSVGLDLGVVTPKLYALMVLMALATTAMTSPMLAWLKKRAKPGDVEDLLTDLVPTSNLGPD